MKLEVWIEGSDAPVGVLERLPDASMRFSYGAGVPLSRALSMSLPVRAEPYGDAACNSYFSNLLFEGAELERIRALHGVDRGDVAGLLWHVGADSPGAVSITPGGAGPGKMPGRFPEDYDRLSQDDMARIVRSLHERGRLPDEARNPSPVAGVQGKIACLARPDGYWLPKPGTGAPTTHILKVAPKADPRGVAREVALLHIATAAGIDAAPADYVPFEAETGEIGAILSTRFDRTEENGVIRRIHAEDFCQALGLPPALKYERDAVSPDRRFDAAGIGSVISGLAAPGRGMDAMRDQTLFNLLVGNTDNHAKNATVHYAEGGARIAPLYDVVPVIMDLNVTHQMGFTIGGAAFVDDVTPERLLTALRAFGYRKPTLAPAAKRLRVMARAVDAALEATDDAPFAGALSAQAAALGTALNIDLGVAPRARFDRSVRDLHGLGF